MYSQAPDFNMASNRRSLQNDYPSQHPNNINTGRIGENKDLGSDQEGLRTPPQTSQQPQHNGTYVLIPPNQAKRDTLLTMARKEQEEYEQFLETRRPGPINLTPVKLGGSTTEAGARQQQQLTQSQSKYKKMLQKEEQKRRIRAEEEAKIQEMKDIQRKKAEKLEEKKRQEDMMRQRRWQDDRRKTNNEFLDRISQSANNCPAQRGNLSHAWEEDEAWILEETLRASIQMHKEEEERRRLKSEVKTWHRQKEDEELGRRLKSENEAQFKQANQTFYKQHKEEEERQLQHSKEEQRKKDELEKKNEEKEQSMKLSQQEEQRRINNAFLDRLQRQNAKGHEYTGESSTWA